MDNSLIQILKSFSKEELKEFEKLLKSPFFKKERDVFPLYKDIIRFYPEFQKGKIEKKEVFMRIYKNKPYKDQTMRTLLSDLQRLFKEYLIQHNLRENKPYRHIFAINELSSRRIDKLTAREIKLFDTFIEKEKFRIEDYFHLKLESDFLKITYHLQVEDYKYFHNKISTLSENLVCKLLENLAFTVNAVTSFSSSSNTEANLDLISELVKNIDYRKILREIKKRSKSDYVVAALAYYSMISALYPNEHDYFRFKELLTGNYHTLSLDNVYNYFSHLERACMHLSMNQREKFDRELFELGVFQLDNNIYTHSQMKYLSVTLFRSYLIRAFLIGEKNWILEFISHYQSKLPPDSVEKMRLYSSAYESFCRGDYKNSLKNISGISADEIKFKVELKKLALMALYEAGMIEDCFYSLDAYRHYLKKNKYINPVRVKADMDFIRFYKELLGHRTGTKIFDIPYYISKVKKSKTEYYRWLIEKARELENPL